MKRYVRTLAWLGTLLIGLGISYEALAFSIGTHRLLNGGATQKSSTDAYLKEQLGLPKGLETLFGDQSASEWITSGGAAEDQAFGFESLGAAVRSINHFHNPLLSWDQAGLNATSPCPPFFLSGQASVRWAQNSNQELSGRAAWTDARQAFLQALTLSSKAERDTAFAQTFQILGQQMHLIADLAAPAHTRNDPHCPSPDGFEDWASRSGKEPSFQGLLAGPPIRPDLSIFTLGVPISDPIAKVPIARLWDTDQYVKINPDITLSPAIGLAEYSNANFFSDDTIFSTDQLPFPAPTSVELGPPEPEPKTGELRRYFKKVRHGEVIDHLAVPSALYEFLSEALKDQKKGLDSNVFRDYAAKLLPRAVGYSAALLDYFFRGSLAVRAYWDDGKVVLDLSNEGDEIMEGVFEVYAIYDKDSVGERRVKLASLEGGAATTLQAGSSRTFQVDVPSGQGLTHHYILVFRGRLGEEVDAVVGHLFLLTPRVLFVQQGSLADIKLELCDRYVWPDPGNPSPGDNLLAEENLFCWWTTTNRQINGTLVKNVVDPIVKSIVVRTGISATGTRSATVWERRGAEPDPVAITFTAPDSPFFLEQGVLFLNIQLTDGPTISTRLATLGVGSSVHAKKIIYYEADGRNKTYVVVSTKHASLAISFDRDRDKTISIGGYTNPTNARMEQWYGGRTVSEGVEVNSNVYSEDVIITFNTYQGGWIEPPKFDPGYAAPQAAFDAIQIQEGLPIKWESVVKRVYYRGEAEFLRAFMPDVPPQFTIQLSGPQQ